MSGSAAISPSAGSLARKFGCLVLFAIPLLLAGCHSGLSQSGEQEGEQEGGTVAGVLPGAAGLLAHLDNVGDLIAEALKLSAITRLEVHGVEGELAKLREPLANLDPLYFTMEYGMRH